MGTKNQCLQDYFKANFENIFAATSPYDVSSDHVFLSKVQTDFLQIFLAKTLHSNKELLMQLNLDHQ